MTLPQNGAKAAREYCACGAEASQNDGVTTVTKFRPMPIKYSALQRANLALQPRLQLDSLVVAHTISASRGTKSFFHDGRGFVRSTAVLALHRRCFPAKEIARGNKLPVRPRSNFPVHPLRTAHSLRKSGKITSGSDQSRAHAKQSRERDRMTAGIDAAI